MVSRIAANLSDIRLRARTTRLGLPVELDVYVIIAAPSSNRRFGGGFFEFVIIDGALRFSKSGAVMANRARVRMGLAVEWCSDSVNLNHGQDRCDVFGFFSNGNQNWLI